MEIWFAMFGGLGVGGLLASLLQSWLANRGKKRTWQFEERREAYELFFETYTELAKKWSNESVKNLGYAEVRVRLVASVETIEILDVFMKTEAGSDERECAQKNLLTLMRQDLGLAN